METSLSITKTELTTVVFLMPADELVRISRPLRPGQQARYDGQGGHEKQRQIASLTSLS